MDAMADAVTAAIPVREPGVIGALTFRAYALRTPAVRQAFRDEMAAGLAMGADWMRAQFQERDLPMPADALVRVINALAEGLLFQRFLTPDLMPDEVIRQAFKALADAGGKGA
jgi:hypothetical protein